MISNSRANKRNKKHYQNSDKRAIIFRFDLHGYAFIVKHDGIRFKRLLNDIWSADGAIASAETSARLEGDDRAKEITMGWSYVGHHWPT